MPILLAIGAGLLAIVWQVVNQVVTVLIRPLINKLQADDPQIPISPADAADMVERNILSEGEGAAMAAQWGVRPGDFALMVKDTGEPYGIVQALDLLRRGLIDEGRFTEVVYYSRVRNEFVPTLLHLAHDTMTGGDAITAALKGVLDQGTAQELFARAGGMATQFQTLLATAGNPIGVQQALRLLNHGLITEGQARDVIRHSRINPAFETMALLLRHEWIGAFQVEAAVKAGVVDAATGTEWLVAEGYTQAQATALMQGAASGKTLAHKTITESQIADMFEVGAISRAEATQRLVTLGYQANEVTFILALFDEKRHMTMISGAVGQVRKVFLAGRITKTAASNALDSLGIDPEARTWVLETWVVEKASELRELTPAQVGAMVKKGFITTAEALSRWVNMGYSPTDAALLLADYGGPPPPSSPAATAAAAAAATTPTTTTPPAA